MVTLHINSRQLFKISGAKLNLYKKETAVTGLIKPIDT